jgi:hypothetical protein
MSKLLQVVVLCVALLGFAGTANAATRVAHYDNATVYLYDEPCSAEDKELKRGKVVYKNGPTVRLCWAEDTQAGVIWQILETGQLAAEDAQRYKQMGSSF